MRKAENDRRMGVQCNEKEHVGRALTSNREYTLRYFQQVSLPSRKTEGITILPPESGNTCWNIGVCVCTLLKRRVVPLSSSSHKMDGMLHLFPPT